MYVAVIVIFLLVFLVLQKQKVSVLRFSKQNKTKNPGQLATEEPFICTDRPANSYLFPRKNERQVKCGLTASSGWFGHAETVFDRQL